MGAGAGLVRVGGPGGVGGQFPPGPGVWFNLGGFVPQRSFSVSPTVRSHLEFVGVFFNFNFIWDGATALSPHPPRVLCHGLFLPFYFDPSGNNKTTVVTLGGLCLGRGEEGSQGG